MKAPVKHFTTGDKVKLCGFFGSILLVYFVVIAMIVCGV